MADVGDDIFAAGNRRRDRGGAVRRGFSFIELLFAIAILGLGAVMTSAMFLVAIRQTQGASEATSANVIVRNVVGTLKSSVANAAVPVKPSELQRLDTIAMSAPFNSPAERIIAADPRYAWLALIRRESDVPFAKVYVWVVRSRNRDFYTRDDLTGVGGMEPRPATLQPREVQVNVIAGANGAPDMIRFVHAFPSEAELDAAAEGAYLVIASDPNEGRTVGNVYRLAGLIDASTRMWELDSTQPLKPEDATENARAFIVGRGWVDPKNPSRGYAGPAQDVLVYQSLLALVGPPAKSSEPTKEW